MSLKIIKKLRILLLPEVPTATHVLTVNGDGDVVKVPFTGGGGSGSSDTQILVGSSTTVQNSWSSNTIFFTNSCTITVPATLDAAFKGFVFRTMPGVTVTWAITTPFVWETTPIPTIEKTVGSFIRFNGGNTILLDV